MLLRGYTTRTRESEKGSSRKPGFRNTDFSEIELPGSEILGKPLCLGPIAPIRTYRIRPPLSST